MLSCLLPLGYTCGHVCVCNAVHSTDGCGIICIIGPIPRYSDFQVHERRPDGNVTKLTSCSVPSELLVVRRGEEGDRCE